jgi:phage protein D/phage baseplate assembly protein gpV
MAEDQLTFSNWARVTIDGADLTQVLEETRGECWVESSVNMPAAFHIEFNKSADELMKEFSVQLRIGAKVEVYAIADGQGKDSPLITGLVTGLETDLESGVRTTVLRGFDHSFKMQRRRRATGWQGMTAAEIVGKLAGLDGVEVGEIQSTSPVYENITQPNVSDWEFTQYLAGQSGMTAYFDTKGLLQFVKTSSLAAAALSECTIDFNDVYRCRTGVTAMDQVSLVTSRGWDEDEKSLRLGTAAALSSPDYKIGMTPADAIAAFGGVVKLTETGTPYGSTAEAQNAASSLAADIASAFAEMEMQVRGWPSLLPGGTVILESAGDPFDGVYRLTATRHVFSKDNGYTTWLWVTGRQARTLYGLGSGGLLQSQPRIPGVVSAIVTDIEDTKQQGRVKVRFPWFDGTYTTDWVRTVQFGGLGGGGVISPEVNDEVLVAFDRGSMDYPYVIGGLYSNSANKPSEHDTDLVTGGRLNRRSLVSRTGHRLELLDDTAEEKTGVRLQSGDKSLTVFLEESKQTITVSSNGTIDVSGDGVVSISSHSRLELRAPQVSIMGDQINIIGNTTIDGDVNINGAFSEKGASNFLGDVNITGASQIGLETTLTGAVNVIGTLALDGVPGTLVG